MKNHHQKSPAIIALTDFLKSIHQAQIESGNSRHISIVDMDNVLLNGNKLRQLVSAVLAETQTENSAEFEQWLAENVTFHNSMVDRIVSHREGDTNVPRGEPIPVKALVIEDLQKRLPTQLGGLGSLGVSETISIKKGNLFLKESAYKRYICVEKKESSWTWLS